MLGWTTRTSALLPVHRDDPLDTMVHSAAYGADLVVEVCREEDDDSVMIGCTVKTAHCALDILYTYRG